LGVKRPGLEADHSLPSSTEIKECVELYLHSSNTPSWRCAQLKHRDNFNVTFFTFKITLQHHMHLLQYQSGSEHVNVL